MKNPVTDEIRLIWRGQEKLWKVFWIGFIFPQLLHTGVGFFFQFLILGLYFLGAENWQFFKHSGRVSELLPLLFFLLGSLYYIAWAVGVWRCSRNTESPFYGILARFFSLLPVPLTVGIICIAAVNH